MARTVEQVTSAPVAAPGRLGQATAVEQSRAVAEVQAAIVVAQQCPRSLQAAVAAMQDSCRQPALAEKAFFRYRRADKTITGPSVHLARELARCFGNVQYGLAELRRDDEAGQSEMQAYAWDVQTNTRSATVFIVPHRRDTREGPRELTDVRDVYENNANQGARRVREVIFAILPPWFTEQAKDLCTATLADGGGKPLGIRISDAVKSFGELGVTADRLEQKLGRKADDWTPHDVAQLGVTYQSLTRGEITIDEEFPPQRVTIEELATQTASKRKTRKTGSAGVSQPSADEREAAAEANAAPAEPTNDTPWPPSADETAELIQEEITDVDTGGRT